MLCRRQYAFLTPPSAAVAEEGRVIITIYFEEFFCAACERLSGGRDSSSAWPVCLWIHYDTSLNFNSNSRAPTCCFVSSPSSFNRTPIVSKGTFFLVPSLPSSSGDNYDEGEGRWRYSRIMEFADDRCVVILRGGIIFQANSLINGEVGIMFSSNVVHFANRQKHTRRRLCNDFGL